MQSGEWSGSGAAVYEVLGRDIVAAFALGNAYENRGGDGGDNIKHPEEQRPSIHQNQRLIGSESAALPPGEDDSCDGRIRGGRPAGIPGGGWFGEGRAVGGAHVGIFGRTAPSWHAPNGGVASADLPPSASPREAPGGFET